MPCTICKQPGHNKRTCKKEFFDCAICYDKCDYKLKCGHTFHATCIYEWIEINPIKNNKCPYCQKPILSQCPQKIKKIHPLTPILLIIRYVLEKLERLFG